MRSYPYPDWPYGTPGPYRGAEIVHDPFDPREPWRGWRPDGPSPYNPGGGSFRGSLPAEGLTSREREIVEIATRSACGGGSGSGGFRGATDQLSPESFTTGPTVSQPATSGGFTPMVYTELRKCARGLASVSADLRDASTKEDRQKALLEANSQFYYCLGLLCSQGVVLSQDVPGRSAEVETRASDGCERLGREIDRLLGGRGGTFETGGRIADAAKECFGSRGGFETAGRIADAAKACYRSLMVYDLESGEAALPVAEDEEVDLAIAGRGTRRPPTTRR